MNSSSDNKGKCGWYVRGESCKKAGKRKRSKDNRRKAKQVIRKGS